MIKKIKSFDRPYMFVIKVVALLVGLGAPLYFYPYGKVLGEVDSLMDASNQLCDKFEAPSLKGFVDINAIDGSGVPFLDSRFTGSHWVEGKLNIMVIHNSNQFSHVPEGAFDPFRVLISNIYRGNVAFHILSINKGSETMGMTSQFNETAIKSHWSIHERTARKWRKAVANSRRACGIYGKPRVQSGTVVARSPKGKFYIGHVSERSFPALGTHGDIVQYIMNHEEMNTPVRPDRGRRMDAVSYVISSLDVVAIMKEEGYLIDDFYPTQMSVKGGNFLYPYDEIRRRNDIEKSIIKPLMRIQKKAWSIGLN